MAIVKKISELTAKGSNIGANDLVIVGVSNGTDYDLKSVTGNQLVGAAIAQTITNGVTTTAPSQDAVFDALALKVDTVVGSRLITSAESTLLGNTSGVNTGDQDLSGYQPLLSGGTTNRLTKWSSSSAITSSLIQDNGTTLSIGTTPVANNLVKVSSNATDTTLVSENSQASGVGISGSSSGSNGIGGSFTSTSVTGVKIGVNASSTGAGGTNKGAVFGATNGVTNYSIQLTDGTEGSGKFLKSVTANGEANWASIANTDVSGLGTLSTQSGTFSGTSSGTNTGDQVISDATITTTDITTNNFTTAKHGFVPKGTNVGNFLKDDGTWGTPASGGASGIWGIANSSGVYTYYATWALAVAAAVSGQCIELFADITESANTYILKNGVNVNGNGHTLTHNFANHGFTDNAVSVQCSINNLTLIKSNSPYYALSIQNGATNINGNAILKGTQGIVICSGKINGFTIIGGYCLELNASTSVGSNLNVYCTTGTCVILTNGGKINNSYVNTINGVGIIQTSGETNNCTVYANGNSGITLTAGNVNNCSVLSLTSNAINSSAGTVINGGSFISTGQTIGGISGYANNAYFRSTVNDGIGLAGNINNCVVISDLYSPVISGGVFQMYNCEIISLTSRASNYGVTSITAGSYVVDSIFTISSISTAIHSAGTPTVYLSGNSVKGTTSFKSAGVVNGQTNVQDLQGNIILN